MQIVVINGIEYAPLIKKGKKSKDALVNYYMKEILKSNIFKSKN